MLPTRREIRGAGRSPTGLWRLLGLGAALVGIGLLTSVGGVFAVLTDTADTRTSSVEQGPQPGGPFAAVGDRVWSDLDHNGLQGPAEPGVDGVTVTLLDEHGDPVTVDGLGAPVTPQATHTVLGQAGTYHFTDLTPGTYRVHFSGFPPGAQLTLQGTVPGDGTDSDPDPATGTTGDVVLVSGEDDVTVDAGLFTPQPALALEKRVQGADADTAPGVPVAVGSTVTFDYLVTNTGNEPLANLDVTDDQGVTVTCPATTVAVGATVICSGTDTAVAGAYVNVGTAEAEGDVSGTAVSAQESAHYLGVEPLLALEKQVNGQDADSAADPAQVATGDPVTFTFHVENTGTESVDAIALDDSVTGPVTCPETTLAPGDDMDCTPLDATAAAGLHTNVATVTGTGVDTSTAAGATDSASYFGRSPGVSFLKEVLDPGRGQYLDGDADAGSPGSNDGVAAVLAAGSTAQYRLTLANTGNIALAPVDVSDPACDNTPALTSGDGGVADTLDVGETWVLTCVHADVTASFTNTATVTAGGLDASERAHVEVVAAGTPGVGVTKQVRDPATGQFGGSAAVAGGGTAEFRLLVTNTGDVPLTDIAVTDAQVAGCDRTVVGTLAPAQSSASWTCTRPAVTAPFTNIAEVTARPVGGGDPVTGSGSATVAVVSPAAADMSLTKALTGVEGGLAEWRITVRNLGPGAVGGPITVTDDLPDGLTFDRASGVGWTCTGSQTVTCTHAGGLADGASSAVTVFSRIGAGVTGPVTNHAELTGVLDANVSNNTDAAVLSAADIAGDRGGHPGGGGGGSGGVTNQPLPATGSDPLGLVVAGVALITIGGLLLWHARRRRRAIPWRPLP